MTYFNQWIIIAIDPANQRGLRDGQIVHVIDSESFVDADRQFNAWLFEHGVNSRTYRLFGHIQEKPAIPRRETRGHEAAAAPTSDSTNVQTYTGVGESPWPAVEASPYHTHDAVAGGGGGFDGGGASVSDYGGSCDTSSSSSSDSGSCGGGD